MDVADRELTISPTFWRPTTLTLPTADIWRPRHTHTFLTAVQRFPHTRRLGPQTTRPHAGGVPVVAESPGEWLNRPKSTIKSEVEFVKGSLKAVG